MNLKARKSILTAIMLTLVSMAMFIALPSEVHAVRNVTKYFGITELNEDLSPNWGYSIMDPKDNATGVKASQIWNIREYQSDDASSARVASAPKDYYCVKAGVGFANQATSSSSLKRRQAYSLEYDMKSEATEAATKLAINSNTNDSVNRYDALLALLDDIYKLDNTSRDRIAWLRSHNALSDDYIEHPIPQAEETLLTEGDIMAVQQAAVWYFTNYENSTLYDMTEKPNWLYYTENGNINNYNILSDYNPDGYGYGDDEYGDTFGEARLKAANKLYKNLISTAKTNATKYAKYRTGGASAGAPATLTTEELNYEKSTDGKNYILGPITITKNSANPVDYEIALKLTNGTSSGTINYTLLGENKQSTSSSIKQLVEAGKSFYLQVPVSSGNKFKVEMSINYKTSTIKLYTNADSVTQPVVVPVEKQESVPGELQVEIPETPSPTPSPKTPEFDLKLIKRIAEVNGEPVTERLLDVDISKLASGEETTADYKMNKDPYPVNQGDIVTYKLRVYNEGEVDGYAKEITEDIPEGLKYLYSSDPDYSSYTAEEKAAASENDGKWTIKPLVNGKVTEVTTDALANELLKAFDPAKPYSDVDPKNPDYREVTIKLKVVAENETGRIIRNEAAITEDADKENKPVKDRDSDTEDWKKYEDDEDYDNVVLQVFDLSLRKFIIAKSDDQTIENNEYLGEGPDGPFDRQPQVDTSKLNTEQNGELVTTAEYNHTKAPEPVKVGQYVVYMIRVYNEGTMDGYAAEIKDHLPPYLEFIDNDFNKEYKWTVSADGRTVTTTYLADRKLLAAEKNGKPSSPADTYTLDYDDVPIMCQVKDTAPEEENITNIADITKYEDGKHEPAEDRDSEENNLVKPKDEELPDYKGDEPGPYVPGQEDDDDFEKVVIKKGEFDLALRKFIIAVSSDTTIEDGEYLKEEDGSYTREPQVDASKLNTTDENGEKITTAEYNHPKDPVLVKVNDIVVYMIRVYNEGDLDGYAAEIKDHLPPYLEFVDGDFNDQYGWSVSEDGRTVTTEYLKSDDKLIKAAKQNADGTYELDGYQEVPIMCKVKDSAPRNENITNIADITKYEDEDHNSAKDRDRDSEPDNVELPSDSELPDYKGDEPGPYVPGQEDDDDFEKVIIKKFDLALRKWVTQAIVTDKSGTTVTNTGHQPYDDPEDVVKVELHRKKLNEVTVKFRYSIRVVNEGDIEGYATEITDYVPDGLKFVQEDNPLWTDAGNNVIKTTQLKDKLLKPGEYADIEVVLTWVNNANNMGVKTNTAEISEDYNEYGVPDEDSTPDNKKPKEDDIDDAPVMLAVSTGQVRIYFTLGFAILITLAAGVVSIKKYVLR